jgi:hypothetical protein
MVRINCGTETHCNYTGILCVRNAVGRSAVTDMATAGNVEVMSDIFNVRRHTVIIPAYCVYGMLLVGLQLQTWRRHGMLRLCPIYLTYGDTL